MVNFQTSLILGVGKDLNDEFPITYHSLWLIFSKIKINFINITLESDNKEFSKEMCRSMVAMMDVNRSGKLGLEEFKTLLCEIAKWKVILNFP